MVSILIHSKFLCISTIQSSLYTLMGVPGVVVNVYSPVADVHRACRKLDRLRAGWLGRCFTGSPEKLYYMPSIING